jgi:hypothetical protein
MSPNGNVTHQDPTAGFGVGIAPHIIGRPSADDQDTLPFSGRYSLDGYVCHPRKRREIRVNLRKLANRRHVGTIDTSCAGNDMIFVREPISASLAFRLHLQAGAPPESGE